MMIETRAEQPSRPPVPAGFNGAFELEQHGIPPVAGAASHTVASARHAPRTPRARAGLLALATANPPHTLKQADVAHAVQTIFADAFRDSDRLAGVFASTGIRRRYAARPLDWYLTPHGWPDRMAVYAEAAAELYVEVANRALAEAGCAASDVDAVVTVSTSGIVAPSLDAIVHERMGFRADVQRLPIFGLGCAGGVSGLAVASRLAEARPGSTVLMVTVELNSLSFRLDRADKASLVSTALFGDGAAACVVRTGEAGIAEIEGAGEHLWPGTLDVMGWSVDPVGFGVILKRDVPSFAQDNLAPAVRQILGSFDRTPEEVDRFVCHPGGAKVVVAIERAFGLDQGSLDHERGVLADYGNMSAPTVLFILKRAIVAGLPKRAALLSMGPGFTASCLSLVQPA